MPTTLLGTPYDRPVVGYGGQTINTLRLWGAATPDYFDFGEFNRGDFFGAVHDKVVAESLTRVLYPDDSTRAGDAALRAGIFPGRLLAGRHPRPLPPEQQRLARLARQGRHPAQRHAPGAGRRRVDAHPARPGQLSWDEAWDLTVRTLAYTNHTLLPEALEKWPVELFEMACRAHLEIIYEINRRFLDDVRARYPGDQDRVGA